MTVPAARRERRERVWQRDAWQPQLGWVASLPTLTDRQYQALVDVNRWLASPAARVARDGVRPPARLRSSEVFGDEKLLEGLLCSGPLSGAGRLSEDLLWCRRMPPPITVRQVGVGPDVLVVENADPFWALADIIDAGDSSDIGWLAWGQGGAVSSTVLSIWELVDNPRHVWYWGDLDPRGVNIAVEAAQRAQEAGRVLRAHTSLWTATAALEPTQGGTQRWQSVTVTGTEWLGDVVWQTSSRIREAAGRVAQERLGLEVLSTAMINPVATVAGTADGS